MRVEYKGSRGEFSRVQSKHKPRLGSELQKPGEKRWVPDVHACSLAPGNVKGQMQGC